VGVRALGLALAALLLVACGARSGSDAGAPDAGAGHRLGSSIYVPAGGGGGGAPTGAAGGDLSGTYPNPGVANVSGAAVPASGALTTGNVLQVTGVSTLSYAPVNLAGGANFVSGSLPTANQVAQSMAGDVTGTTAASVVGKVNGTSFPAGGALTTGNSPYASAVGAVTYSALNLAGGSGWVSGLLPAGNQAAQTMGGAVGGTTAASTILLTGNGSITGVLPAANQAAQTLTGDVTGNTGASVVAKVNGSTVPAGGALTTGNSLQVTGAGALSYAALNLAGGANYVSGSLPTANQVAQTMSGDVTGNTGAAVVAKVNGSSVPAGGALTTGNGPYVSGASALTYSALNLAGGAGWVTGSLPAGNQASQTMGGDVTGTTASCTVAKIQNVSCPAPSGTGTVLTYSGSTLSWAAASGGITALTGDVTASGTGSVAATVVKENGVSFKSGTPAIWSQMTYDSNATQWAGIGPVSATLTDASITIDCGLSVAGTLNASQFVLPAATALTASRTLTVNTDSAVTNETISIVRLGLGAFTLVIVNGGTGGGTLLTMPASKARAATLTYDGTNWLLVGVISVN
jgi:hypothetical protein